MFCGTGAGRTAAMVGMHGRPAQCPQVSSRPAPAPPSRETIPGPGLPGCRTFRPSREIPGQTGTRWSPYSSAAVLNFHPIPSQPRPSSSPFLPRSSLEHLTLRSPLRAYVMSSSTPDAREQAPSFCVWVCPPGCIQDPRSQAAAAQKTWSPSSQTPGQLWICSLLPGFLLMAERRLEISNQQRHRPSRRP